jgi:hypothetical protein
MVAGADYSLAAGIRELDEMTDGHAATLVPKRKV